jgi:aminopeptidase N
MTFEHRLHDRCACNAIESQGAPAAPRAFPLGTTSRVYERALPFRIEHIELDLRIAMAEKAVDGIAVLDVRRVDKRAKTLVLDAVGFDVHGVSAAAGKSREASAFRKVAYVADGESIRVELPVDLESVSVRVAWRATPRRGMYFLAPDEHVANRPRQVWTQCQDEDARRIFPCHDKPHQKSTYDIAIHVAPGQTVLSNGELVGTPAERAQGTFRWSMRDPMPSYLFTVVAGDLEVIEARAGDLPLSYLFPPGRRDDAMRAFGRTPEMVKLFADKTGVPYPFVKYAQVVVSDFTFGGMENTTATTMYEHILLDEKAALDVTSDDLVAHELAHHWFGDLVTCRDWSHAWLNEGFATYMESVDREAHKGRDEYEHGLLGELGGYVAEARGRYRRPVVCNDYELPIDLFDRHLYEKGGLVLHLLRTELGDDVFWGGVRTYLEKHAHGIVETRDLQRALEAASGRSLDRFFEQWLHRPGHPELAVRLEWSEGVLTVAVSQTQSTTAMPAVAGEALAVPIFSFELTVDLLEPEDKGSDKASDKADKGAQAVKRHVLRVERAAQSFAIPVAKRPAGVVLDADLRVLGEINADVPSDWMRCALESAPTARGRVLAAHALARKNDLPNKKALEKALLREEEFWGVRAECATALGEHRTGDAFTALAAGAKVAHPKVRRAVATALGRWKSPAAAAALEPLALADPSYLVQAAAARAIGATRQPLAFDLLVSLLDRPSWADVVRAGAVDGLAVLRDERAVPHLLAKIRYGVPQRARRAAIFALAQLSQDRKSREALEDQLDAEEPYVLFDVVRALGEIADVRSRAPLSRLLDGDLDGRVRRKVREVLRDLVGPPRRDAAVLRDDLETLRKEQADVIARLGKMEARLKADAPDAEPKAASATPTASVPPDGDAKSATKPKGVEPGKPASKGSAKARKGRK